MGCPIDGGSPESLQTTEATFRCRYVARQVSVKTRYRLWVTPAERTAIVRVLENCS